VRHYVRIQRFRFSDNFDFTTQLSPDTLSCQLIRFILQPLVENSIIHGFQDVADHYQIRIASFISDGKLHIKIIDNGSGMNPETTNAVNKGIDGGTRYNHIGVANIRDRIKLHFGEQYGLSYSSVPFVGTIAEVVLPNQTESGEET
jgi:two-component system sensor histidine kinase YesM